MVLNNARPERSSESICQKTRLMADEASQRLFPQDFGSYRIQQATEEYYEDIVQNIRDNFVPGFKINVVMPNAVTTDHIEDFGYFAAFCLPEGVSVVAIDNETNKVIGARVSMTLTADNAFPKYKTIWSNFRSQHTLNIHMMGYAIGTVANPFERYQAEKIYDCCLLSTAKEHQNKGIATNLLDCAMQLAKAGGCQLAKGWFIGPVSQRAAEKNGMETVCEMKLKEFKNEKGEVVFADANEDVNTAFKAKRL